MNQSRWLISNEYRKIQSFTADVADHVANVVIMTR